MPVKTVTILVQAMTDRANAQAKATSAIFDELRSKSPVEMQVKLDKLQAQAEARIFARELSKTVTDVVKLQADSNLGGGLLARLFRGGQGPGRGLPGVLGSIPGVGPIPAIGQMPPAVAAGGAVAVLAALPLLAQAAATIITFGLGSALVGLGVYAEKGRKGVVTQFAGLQADVTKTFNNLSPAFGDALVTILSAARTFVPQFIRDFKPALDGLSLPLKSLGVELAGTLASPQIAAAIRALGVAFGGILKAITPAIPGIVTAIADGFTRLFQAVAKNPKAITEMFVGLGHLIGVLLDVLAWLTNVADYLEHHWKPALTGVAAVVIDHWRGLRTFFGDLRQWLYDDFLLKTEQFFVTAWDKIWNNTIGAVTRGVASVELWFGRLVTGIQHAFASVPRDLFNIGKGMLDMLLSGAKSAVGGITSWFSGFAHGIVGIFKKIWGWFSPSSVMYQGGKSLMEGLAAGIRDHAHLAQQAALGAAIGGLTGAAGGNVTSWIMQALRVTGTPMSWLQGMLTLVMKESGGNPRAYNPQVAGSSGEHAEGIAQCVSLETEILTRRGWLRHDQVQAGDETIGYNPVTARSEWTQITKVVRFEDAEVWRIGNKCWHADVTPEHRWWSDTLTRVQPVHETCPECGWIPRGQKMPARGVQVHRNKIHGIMPVLAPLNNLRGEFVRTHSFRTNNRIRMAAPADTDGIPGLSLEECAIVGWLTGDGHVRRPEPGQGHGWDAWIYQAKPAQVIRLRALLSHVPHTERTRDRGNPRHRLAHEFRLRRAYATDLLKRARWGEISPEKFVLSLSPDQRAAWLAAVIDAEGHRQPGKKPNHRGFTRITQCDGPVADAMILAVYLDGWRPTLSRKSRRSDRHNPACSIGMAMPHLAPGMFQPPQVLDRQPVWCVKTDLETWTARLDGQIFLTGNTIPSTFAAYGIGGSIWNPVADLIASIRYIKAVYGSVYNIQGITGGFYGGYDQGGWLMPGTTVAVNRSGRPERVTSGAAEDAMLARLDAIIGRLDTLTGVTAQAPAVMGAALGMGGRSAVYGALYP